MNIVFLLRPKSTVAYLYSDNTLRQGLEKMRAHGYTAIPVIDRAGRYEGTVSEGDFLWHMVDHESGALREQEQYRLDSILRLGWNPAASIDTEMDALLERVMDQNFVPIVDCRGVFMGIITRRDVLAWFRDRQAQREAPPLQPPCAASGALRPAR